MKFDTPMAMKLKSTVLTVYDHCPECGITVTGISTQMLLANQTEELKPRLKTKAADTGSSRQTTGKLSTLPGSSSEGNLRVAWWAV